MEVILIKQKRPKWVWAIFIFYFFSAGFTLLSYYLLFTGVTTLTPEENKYFDSLSKLDHGLTIIIGSLNLLAALSLFMLKRTALYLFTASISIGILVTGWHIIYKGWFEVLGGIGGSSLVVSTALGWCLILAIYMYTWKLYKTKVLN